MLLYGQPMRDMTIFLETTHQQGYSREAAQVALASLEAHLNDHGYPAERSFYIYRTGGKIEGAGDEPARERPRMLLAFSSADTALSFAQHNQLHRAPRLLRVSVPQLLAILVQRPTIQAIMFVNELVEAAPRGQLPAGLRLDRAAVLNMLEEGMSHEQSL